MSDWDRHVFDDDANVEFLDEMSSLDDEDIVEAVADACFLATRQDHVSDEEQANALCAATIAAIWAGAPYSAGEVIDEYPFIKDLTGSGSEELREAAATLLEEVEDDEDVEVYLEALA